MKLSRAIEQSSQWSDAGERVVLVTGVFDIVHIEHMRFLKKAKAAGTKLIVGVECDSRVTAIKGEGRPVNDEGVRIEQLECLEMVDMAFVMPDEFDSQEDWERFMQDLGPAVYAVSSHTSYQENKQRIAEKYGVEFAVVHEFNPDISTSQLFQRLSEEL